VSVPDIVAKADVTIPDGRGDRSSTSARCGVAARFRREDGDLSAEPRRRARVLDRGTGHPEVEHATGTG
jgi:hypothetical protein